MHTRSIAVLAIALLVVGAGASTAVAGAEDLSVSIEQQPNGEAIVDNESVEQTATLEPAAGLEVTVDQDPGEEATVTVTDNETAVENATVNVSTGNETVTYDGVGEYETDEDGTVTLPAPNETVTVEIEAAVDDRSVATSETLHADTIDRDLPFGLQLQQFMQTVGEHDRPWGHIISDWVTANNPGNAPDHAGDPGPPEHAGGSHADNASNETDDDRGPSQGADDR